MDISIRFQKRLIDIDYEEYKLKYNSIAYSNDINKNYDSTIYLVNNKCFHITVSVKYENQIRYVILKMDKALVDYYNLVKLFSNYLFEKYVIENETFLFYSLYLMTMVFRRRVFSDNKLDLEIAIYKSKLADLISYTNSCDNYIYLLMNMRNSLYKIGHSKYPNYREKTLQSEEPEIRIVFSEKAKKQVEKILHEKFKNKRVRGEWFNLSSEEIFLAKKIFFQNKFLEYKWVFKSI